MPSLREAQAEFVHAMFGRSDGAVVSMPDKMAAQRRFNIYRNNYRLGLRDALLTTFPVVALLVGEGFFRMLADAFVYAHPPRIPCLAEYGCDLPSFIATYEPAGSLPYLADVALFEWLMNEAAHQQDYAGNGFYSPHPIGRIWETNQANYHGDPAVNLNEGGGWFIVERAGDAVQWRYLDLPPEAFASIKEDAQNE